MALTGETLHTAFEGVTEAIDWATKKEVYSNQIESLSAVKAGAWSVQPAMRFIVSEDELAEWRKTKPAWVVMDVDTHVIDVEQWLDTYLTPEKMLKIEKSALVYSIHTMGIVTKASFPSGPLKTGWLKFGRMVGLLLAMLNECGFLPRNKRTQCRSSKNLVLPALNTAATAAAHADISVSMRYAFGFWSMASIFGFHADSLVPAEGLPQSLVETMCDLANVVRPARTATQELKLLREEASACFEVFAGHVCPGTGMALIGSTGVYVDPLVPPCRHVHSDDIRLPKMTAQSSIGKRAMNTYPAGAAMAQAAELIIPKMSNALVWSAIDRDVAEAAMAGVERVKRSPVQYHQNCSMYGPVAEAGSEHAFDPTAIPAIEAILPYAKAYLEFREPSSPYRTVYCISKADDAPEEFLSLVAAIDHSAADPVSMAALTMLSTTAVSGTTEPWQVWAQDYLAMNRNELAGGPKLLKTDKPKFDPATSTVAFTTADGKAAVKVKVPEAFLGTREEFLAKNKKTVDSAREAAAAALKRKRDAASAVNPLVALRSTRART